MCIELYEPVCADGITYDNQCKAEAACQFGSTAGVCHQAEEEAVGVSPSRCASLAACDGENQAAGGVSAACYDAVGGIIQSGQAPASWAACNSADQATVPTTCKQAVS